MESQLKLKLIKNIASDALNRYEADHMLYEVLNSIVHIAGFEDGESIAKESKKDETPKQSEKPEKPEKRSHSGSGKADFPKKITDRGKLRALWSAGRDVKFLMTEFVTDEDTVVKALREEKLLA